MSYIKVKNNNHLYRDTESNCIINTNKITFNRSLDEYPSPYLTGEFDYLVDNKDEGEFTMYEGKPPYRLKTKELTTGKTYYQGEKEK